MRVKLPISVFLVSLFYLLFLIFPKNVSAQVVINEVMPNPEGKDVDNEWLEIFNSSSKVIDLNGYILEDAGGAKLIIDESRVSDSTQVGAHGFLVIYRNGHTTFSLNNDTETIDLYESDGITQKDSFNYTGSFKNKTWGRIPDGGDIYSEVLEGTLGSPNQIPASPTPSPSPVLTPTPTPVPTPNPTQSTAVYTINKAKDNNDNPLSNVKIYIDGQYTGNYAEETYNFCDGCKCGSNKVDCGFGSHAFRLEKNGYDDWSKTENITAGDNLAVDPILSKNNPNTPIPTATKTPSPKLPDSSLSPNDDSSKEMVLGLRNDLKEENSGTDSNEKKAEEIKKEKPPVLGGILVFFGLLSLGYAGFYLYRKNKVEYKDGKNTTKIEKEENGK